MKRLFDFLIGGTLLLIASPILLFFCILIYLHDFKNPFYFAPRAGRHEKVFIMIKLRSMIVNADKSGVDSTANNDNRITWIGAMVRKCKLDELTQLINVVKGDMSLVGPRPNVQRETDLYTDEEKRLLSVRPGITDLSSIVFSDEGNILEGAIDPDIKYNQLIRPFKGHLGLFYIDHQSLLLDLRVILLTGLAILNKRSALNGVVRILQELNAPESLTSVAKRDKPLVPSPPPGATVVVTDRNSIPF